MRLLFKIILGLFALFAVAVLALALTLGYTKDCPQPATAQANGDAPRAYLYHCYGPAEVLSLETVPRPEVADDEVLVKVSAAAVNPLDWHYLHGSPYFMRLGTGIGAPKNPRLGVDFAGTVEAVGEAVTTFSVGDEVFGGAHGAFGEFVTVRESGGVALKPANVTFAEAAAVPIAALTAWQALVEAGNLQPGQKVLINGASGGVGTFAVQIAKSLGAEVTGVCSTRNVELVQSLGADHVVDYKHDNYTDGNARYDLIVDMVGNHSLSANRRVMADQAIMVLIGGPKGDWLRPLWRPLGAVLFDRFVEQKFVPFLAQMRGDDLRRLADLMASGEVTPVVDRRYAFEELADAIRYSESGRARGKIIIDIDRR